MNTRVVRMASMLLLLAHAARAKPLLRPPPPRPGAAPDRAALVLAIGKLKAQAQEAQGLASSAHRDCTLLIPQIATQMQGIDKELQQDIASWKKLNARLSKVQSDLKKPGAKQLTMDDLGALETQLREGAPVFMTDVTEAGDYDAQAFAQLRSSGPLRRG